MITYRFLDSQSASTREDLDQLNGLLRQLSPRTEPMIMQDLPNLANKVRFLIARDEDKESRPIIGTATLVLARKPTAVYGLIEDVVVDEGYRGKGIGRELTQRLILEGYEAGAKYIELTSHSSRAAANALYQSLGFELRETNVYRLKRR